MRKQQAVTDRSGRKCLWDCTEKKGLGRSVQSVEAGRCGALVDLCVWCSSALVLIDWLVKVVQCGPRSRGGKRAETGSRLGIRPGSRLDRAPIEPSGWVVAGWPLPFVPL